MSFSPTNSSSSPVASSPQAAVNSSVATNTTHSADITGFFQSNAVRVVSDPEGYHVAQLANVGKIVDGYDAPANKMLVLGDLFDYTLGAGPNGNNFATSKLTELRNAKSNSFESAKYCNDNKDKIKVLFGNRDLNKLKLMPLALVTDSDGNYVKWWEAESYEIAAHKLVELIANTEDDGCQWDIPTMTNWKPFWKPNYDTCKHWNDPNPRLPSAYQNQNMSCLERFYLIFGVDCAQGTMSGQNTLFGVAKECGLYDKIFGSYQLELDNLTQINNNYLFMTTNAELKKAAEYAAALVFTVFADALYGNKTTTGKQFTGVLRDFFLAPNTNYCAYAELAEDLLVFSHGGMREEFFKCNMKEDLVKQISNNEQLKGMIADQSGGYVGSNATIIPAEDIKKRINSYNFQMKSGLIKLITDYQNLVNRNESTEHPKNIVKPTAELLLNLVISAPYAAPDSNGSCFHRHASPIMPGLDHPLDQEKPNAYRAKPICAQGKTLYQFIGHFPLGFAPTIDKYTTGQDGHVSYAINLDVSNSLFGQFDKLEESSIDRNYSYVEVLKKDTELELLSNVKVHLKADITVNKSQTKTELKQILITDYNLLKLPEDETKYFTDTSTKNYNYHGNMEYKGIIYDIFTQVGTNFAVNVFAVNDQQSVSTLIQKFQGGKSIHRHRQLKTKRTGKCKSGAQKLYVRTTRTLVRRCHPSMRKKTGKKLQKKYQKKQIINLAQQLHS